jgi:hypothetical protein
MSAPTCCTHECNQGRGCACRQPREMAKWEQVIIGVLIAVWVVVMVVSLA